MNSNIDYRILESKNLNEYKEIRFECLKNNAENFGILYEEEINSKSLKFDKIITEKNGIDFLLGAFENENLIGICGFIQQKKIKTRHIGEISQMYVKPEFNRKGIATGLIKLAIEKVFNNNVEQIILGVINSNVKALNLYLKMGFIQYGFIENYFKQNENYEAMKFMVLTKEKFENK
jgi:ribosomal protein S18 acetylase RimI-like enzyme